ncbi:TPA: PIG-L family deacetylase [Candidatus Poribacteria bacterium]|nr:PIG-L family deacetylase [Candidatus Poribacteria bacterium]
MNVLAIGAHPDDIEYGCGGTLIKYIQQKHSVYLLILTHGRFGGDPEIRKAEQLASAKLMGVEDVFWGGYADTRIPIDKGLIDKIEEILKRITPSFIFVPYFDDTHQDHRATANASITATRYIKNVLFYECPTTQNFNPNVYVDISSVLDKKLEVLKAHKSQVIKTKIADLTIIESSVSWANFRGIQGRVKYAEAFVPLRLFINV